MYELNTTSPEEAAARIQFAQTYNEHFTLSCLFAGILANPLLCGVFTVMLWQYAGSQSKREDPLWLRCLVGWVGIWSYGFTAFVVYYGAYHFVEGYGQYLHFFETQRRGWLVVFDAVLAVSVQSFFAYRSFRLLNRNYLVLVGILIPAILGLCGSIGILVVFSGSDGSLKGAQLVRTYIFLWEISTIIADTFITLSILCGLLRHRTQWAHTNKLITRLIFMTFECQIPPLICAVTFLVQYILSPPSFFTVFVAGLAPKVYAIGLLFSLNARHNFFASDILVDLDNSTGKDGTRKSHRPEVATIQVDVETEVYEMRNALNPNVGLNRRNSELDKAEDTESEGNPSRTNTPNSNSNDTKAHFALPMPSTPSTTTTVRSPPTPTSDVAV